jgi:elongation factor G
MAFQIAGRAAFREAMKQAHPILLEPIMKVVITAPDRYTGDISGDLNHRRGRLLGMNIEEGMQQITAEVPLAEMHSYSSQLRSITQGRGSFDMEFVRYDQVPAVVSAKIQEEAGKEAEEVE